MVADVGGIEDMRRALADVPRELRRRVLRNALSAGARVVRDAAKEEAPLLQGAAPYRKRGTLRSAIRVRTSKQARRQGAIGVFVNVRPAKAGQRGAKSQDDPFYWRWQEFGWTPATGPRKGKAASVARRERRASAKRGEARKVPGRRFLSRAAQALPRALEKIKASIGPQIQRLNNRRRP